MTQSIFVQKHVFVRDAFAELLFNRVAYGRTRRGSYSSQQRGANYAEGDHWSHTWNRERRRRETEGRASSRTHCTSNRRAHGLAHSRLFSIGDWHASLDRFRPRFRRKQTNLVLRNSQTS
jgi:hypothetical protein